MIESNNPQALAAVALFMSKEATRYYLGGVYIEKTGEITATDGHTLGTFKDVTLKYDGDGVILALPREAITALKKVNAAGWQYENKVLTVFSDKGDQVFRVLRVDGTYPDWRRVFPEIDTGKTLPAPHLNAAYLGKFAKAAATLGNKHAPICFTSSGRNGPSIVEVAGFPGFRGVIMPIRVSEPKAEQAA